MPENVPPKETAKADGLDPNEQAPGVPRDSMADDALAKAKAKAAVDPKVKVDGGDPAPRSKAAADPDAKPGDNFVRVNWKEKIGGHERDGEWCERRRAEGLVASGHAEIVEEKDKK